MHDYGKYKSRNELSKAELLAALTQLQQIASRGLHEPSFDSAKQLSPLNVYCLTVAGERGCTIPSMESLSAANSEKCTKEFRDAMASVSAELLGALGKIRSEILTVYRRQQQLIAEEEASLIDRLKLIASQEGNR